jgi:predicted flap endonuclease-1-like 5' DNA nuclease
MAELVQENVIFLVLALLIGLFVAWWIFAASRRTRVEIAAKDGEEETVRRNQALIDAPPAAVVPPPPVGLAGAGTGEVTLAPADPLSAPSTEGDDLTRIKGLGPKLALQLRELGITRFAQIAGWNEAEVDRIDAQLGRFQGRIRRDDWRSQASLLAAGDTAGYQAKFGKL